MRQRCYLLGLLLLVNCAKAQQTTPVPVDGPYVSYQEGRIYVTTINKDDDLLFPVKDFYPATQKNIVLNVVPEGHADWAFKVKLKPLIENEASIYPESSKTLFLSDIEGEFGNFRKMLLAAKVMDEQYNWTYGTNALVIAGDLFDRGKDVVPELWLLYKLEDEAKAMGGKVHVILGNHDIMNLSGDHRYTDAKYFKNAWLMKTECKELFGKDTELGRWLRSKNVVEKIGDVLVMHGGLSPAVLAQQLNISQLNATCRSFYDAPRKLVPDSMQIFFGKDALFWYRGYFMAPKSNAVQIDSTLAFYKCKNILVGHTIVRWNIASYYGGKVIGIDVDYHRGQPAAALQQNNRWYILNSRGRAKDLKYKAGNDAIKESDIL
ncbi:metallophosphoesterase [Mucilaginibacter pocheonensis]|uniref:Calcineurin-like phosphoesterase domain-containing protein n=1 Tax=Mucilaginibacter pocheonensis TaxID=398050 RepID=A0ABU1T806_9SPHI|nr:metallophosphoesterase [Mucilaginibacter pocheonensis]MDR6941366.1 hypothetical protein [Mucilaginibacter pocheonensis]